jgi:hypothetical protein
MFVYTYASTKYMLVDSCISSKHMLTDFYISSQHMLVDSYDSPKCLSQYKKHILIVAIFQVQVPISHATLRWLYSKAVTSCHLRKNSTTSFHSGDYEERRLLGYKNPGRTSQETHPVSATKPSRLMPCKIWGFQSNDSEECRLFG